MALHILVGKGQGVSSRGEKALSLQGAQYILLMLAILAAEINLPVVLLTWLASYHGGDVLKAYFV